MLRGLSELLQVQNRLPDSTITTIVDLVAPLGLKKMILLLDMRRLPELDPRDVPQYRALQEGDVDDVLHRAGQHLQRTRKLCFGCLQVICFKRLQSLKEELFSCFKVTHETGLGNRSLLKSWRWLDRAIDSFASLDSRRACGH